MPDCSGAEQVKGEQMLTVCVCAALSSKKLSTCGAEKKVTRREAKMSKEIEVAAVAFTGWETLEPVQVQVERDSPRRKD